jgi:tetratricopeptide (TPR) repeat protein
MVIDPRRDHSLRVPRPDLSVSLGVPNACNDCHTGETAAWAAGQVRGWLGRDAGGLQNFAEIFDAAEQAAPGAAMALGRISAGDGAQPAIVRASALHRMADLPEPAPVQPAQAGLADPAPSVRRAALSALGVLPPQVRVLLGVPLLEDVARAVRIDAAWQLAPDAAAFAGGPEAVAFARAVDEFVSAQRLVADRPEGRVTLGEFFARLGRTTEAVEEYGAAIRLGPSFVPAYVGLADLYRRNGDEPRARETLQAGLAIIPNAAGLHHALGLSLARSRRVDEAVTALERAAALAPEEPRFAYAHAVGLHSSGRVDEAIGALEEARQRHPTDRDLLFALATFHRDAGRPEAALTAAARLVELYPGAQDARALVQQLEAGLEAGSSDPAR